MGYGADFRETKRRMPRNRLAGLVEAGGRGAADVFGDIARGYAFGRVAALTDRRTYDASWRLSVNWRSFVGKGALVAERDGSDGARGIVGRAHGVLFAESR